jgi:Rieske Fe-S protein
MSHPSGSGQDDSVGAQRADPSASENADSSSVDEAIQADRREFVLSSSTALMAGGLAAGYGTFFAMAGSYFYPSESNKAWMFVTDTAGFAPGESKAFQSPTGVRVMITRQLESARSGAREDDQSKPGLLPEDFIALSSVCPHLGCRVHWEQHNDRFFCPCHNGVFDPSGKAISGPPADDQQNLPHYPLKIVNGSLYIEMSYRTVRRLDT